MLPDVALSSDDSDLDLDDFELLEDSDEDLREDSPFLVQASSIPSSATGKASSTGHVDASSPNGTQDSPPVEMGTSAAARQPNLQAMCPVLALLVIEQVLDLQEQRLDASVDAQYERIRGSLKDGRLQERALQNAPDTETCETSSIETLLETQALFSKLQGYIYRDYPGRKNPAMFVGEDNILATLRSPHALHTDIVFAFTTRSNSEPSTHSAEAFVCLKVQEAGSDSICRYLVFGGCDSGEKHAAAAVDTVIRITDESAAKYLFGLMMRRGAHFYTAHLVQPRSAPQVMTLGCQDEEKARPGERPASSRGIAESSSNDKNEKAAIDTQTLPMVESVDSDSPKQPSGSKSPLPSPPQPITLSSKSSIASLPPACNEIPVLPVEVDPTVLRQEEPVDQSSTVSTVPDSKELPPIALTEHDSKPIYQQPLPDPPKIPVGNSEGLSTNRKRAPKVPRKTGSDMSWLLALQSAPPIIPAADIKEEAGVKGDDLGGLGALKAGKDAEKNLPVATHDDAPNAQAQNLQLLFQPSTIKRRTKDEKQNVGSQKHGDTLVGAPDSEKRQEAGDEDHTRSQDESIKAAVGDGGAQPESDRKGKGKVKEATRRGKGINRKASGLGEFQWQLGLLSLSTNAGSTSYRGGGVSGAESDPHDSRGAKDSDKGPVSGGSTIGVGGDVWSPAFLRPDLVDSPSTQEDFQGKDDQSKARDDDYDYSSNHAESSRRGRAKRRDGTPDSAARSYCRLRNDFAWQLALSSVSLDPSADYMKEREEKIQKIKIKLGQIPFDCLVCFEHIEWEDGAQMVDCEHSFCKECIRGHVQSKLDDNQYPILCPVCQADRDRVKRGTVEERLLVNIELSEEYQEKYVQLQLAQLSITIDCPACMNSMKIAREDYLAEPFITCPLPRCHGRFCRACQTLIPGSDTDHACKIDDALDTLMRENGWLYCPGCKTPIQKESGCNHMTCGTPGCSTHFCYVCGESIWNSSSAEGLHTLLAAHYQRCEQFGDPPRPNNRAVGQEEAANAVLEARRRFAIGRGENCVIQ